MIGGGGRNGRICNEKRARAGVLVFQRRQRQCGAVVAVVFVG
jgi:hypothetical protein